MNDLDELVHTKSWRIAVWSLRVGFVALAILIIGLIVVALGGTPWILAVGEISWIATVVVTTPAFFRARYVTPSPRPRLWTMRMALLRAAVHTLPPA